MGAAAAVVAAQHARQERELIEHLQERKALSAASATALRPQRGMGQAILRQLLRQKAVRQTDADLYWLDEAAYAAMRSRRVRFAGWAVSIILIVALVAVIGAVVIGQR